MSDLFSTPAARPSPQPSASIQKVVLFMQQHLVEPMSLGQLAQIANLNLLQFTTAFRREIGMPPYRYLSHLRIRVAKELLEKGMPAALVAAEAGFFDQAHMYRHFKRVCGITPGQYRATTAMRAHAGSSARLANYLPLKSTSALL
jgi:transcriptional regulator GlxA family with amidase domain